MEQPIEFLIRAGQADTVDQLREYAVHRLSMSLRRFERRIRHITVRIADVNGPRRGVDSRCSMSVDLVDGKHVFVNAISAWPFAAVSQAASRLSKVLRRKGDRGRAHRDNFPAADCMISARSGSASAARPAGSEARLRASSREISMQTTNHG
jgi:ribosome-associated translation inhibitor RaiA